MPTKAESTVSRGDALALLARRYHNHYGNRLAGVYATPYDPYEPERGHDESGIHVVVVLDALHEHWEETDPISRIAHEVMEEVQWSVPIVPHHVSSESALAHRMQEEGVRLD